MALAFSLLAGTLLAQTPADSAQKPVLAPRIIPQDFPAHRPETDPLKGSDSSAYIATVTPFGLQFYSSVSLEGTVSRRFTAGASLTQTWKEIKGTKMELFGRYYLLTDAPSGLYLQAKGGLGAFTHDFKPTFVGPSETPIQDVRKFYATFYSAGVGYQYIFGSKNNWVIDFSVSYQGSSINPDDFIHSYSPVKPITFQESRIDHSSYVNKYGPAGHFIPALSFGYVLVK